MMSFNNSTSFEDVLYTVSLSITTVLFIPASILYGICIVALLSAKDIKLQIRVLLVNVLISRFIGGALPSLTGFIADHNAIACKFNFSLTLTGFLASLTSITLFSIMVYVFIKYNNNKLKWYIIIPSITVSWIVSILFGTLIYADPTFIRDCVSRFESKLFLPYIIFTWLSQAVFLTVMLVFGILTVCFVRKRILRDTAEDATIQSNPKIKKAITKVLVYFIVGSFLDILRLLIPSLLPILLTTVKPVTLNSIAAVGISTLSALTPIVMIITLKPIRDAIKGFKECECLSIMKRD